MFIATLIACERLGTEDVRGVCDALVTSGMTPREPRWIDADRACDVPFDGDPATARALLEPLIAGVDVVVQPERGRAKRLLVADMDSTMITVECIDELADYAGVKPEVAAITERAMRGELDFTSALHARVALLAGLSMDVLKDCYRDRVCVMPGARALVATMRTHGAGTLLISGGFTYFADRVAADLGFDAVTANLLEFDGDIPDFWLSGRVVGPIVDGARKASELVAARTRLALPTDAILAVGDGANDVAMIAAAGLGVSFRGKPVLAAAADASIRFNDLTALLWAQGYARDAWVEA